LIIKSVSRGPGARGKGKSVRIKWQELFIRAAALALVYLFIGIDDLLMRPSVLDDKLMFIRLVRRCVFLTQAPKERLGKDSHFWLT
jgi:hypothetical protein